MGSGYDDDYAGLADFQAAHAMDYRDSLSSPAFLGLGDDLADLGDGHFGVDIVFQVAHLLAARVIAHYALENHNAAYARISNRCNQRRAVQWLVGNHNYGFHDQSPPPPTGGINTTSSPSLSVVSSGTYARLTAHTVRASTLARRG